MSLLLEIGAEKDEVCSLQSQVGKDKESMEEDYQKAREVIFSYGYEYCEFQHNICEFQKVCMTPPSRCLLSFS